MADNGKTTTYGDILAVDVGRRHVGICFLRRKPFTWRFLPTVARGLATDEVARLVGETGCEAVVLGVPTNEDGSESEQAKDVRAFRRRLERRIGVPVFLADEYASSVVSRIELDTGGDDHARAAREIGITFLEQGPFPETK